MIRKIIYFIVFFIFFHISSHAQYHEDFKKEIPFDTSSNYVNYSNNVLIKHLNGIDVSYYQKTINWDTVKAQNIKFVFIKATEGITIKDSKFDENWENSKKVGITRGAYHFFRPTIDGKQQALLFLKTVKFESGDILPVVDVEYTRMYRRCRRSTYINNLNRFINEVYIQTGQKPIIYTSPYFWDRYYGPYIKIDNHHLWLASYTEEPIPSKYFETHTFWQYSPKGKIKGIDTLVDLNIFYGYSLKSVTF